MLYVELKVLHLLLILMVLDQFYWFLIGFVKLHAGVCIS